MFLFFRAF